MPTHKPFNTNRAIAVLIVAIIVSAWLFIRSYYVSVSVSDNGALVIPRRRYFSYLPLFYMLLFAAEIFIYQWLRRKYTVKRYANIHIASVLVAEVVVPLLYMLCIKIMVYYFSYSTIYAIIKQVVRPIQISASLFLIAGHVFFIMAIIKRNESPPAKEAKGAPGDMLAEFAE